MVTFFINILNILALSYLRICRRHTPPSPLTPQKERFLFFGHNCCAMKLMKKKLCDFIFSSNYWFVHNYQVFFNQINVFLLHLKRCAMFWIGFFYSWVFFLVRFSVFEIWLILYFTLVMHSELNIKFWWINAFRT